MVKRCRGTNDTGCVLQYSVAVDGGVRNPADIG